MNRTYKRKKKALRPQVILALLVVLTIAVTALVAALFKLYKAEDGKPEALKSGESENKPDVSPQSGSDSPNTPAGNSAAPSPTQTRLSFVAAGDNLIHQAIIDDAQRLAQERGAGERYYFDSMYESFKDAFSSADIAFINQESMIAGESHPYQGYPSFNTPPEMVGTLERLGIDVVNIGTNHSFDVGGQGLRACIDAFKSSSITSVGAYESRDDYNSIRIIEKEGVRIAFLSFCYGTNEKNRGAGYESLFVPSIDTDEMTRQVTEAKKISDLVFVSMHWGVGNSFTVSAHQKTSAQALVDAGADVIIGTHPHVLQEIKWKARPDGGKTLIAYSIGNFISTQHPAYNMLGGLLSFDIVKDGEDVYVENPKITPTMTHYSKNRDSLKMYYLKDYSQALYETHGTSLRSESSGWSYDKLVQTVKEIIPAEFLNF